jgi:hypothetical protein
MLLEPSLALLQVTFNVFIVKASLTIVTYDCHLKSYYVYSTGYSGAPLKLSFGRMTFG